MLSSSSSQPVDGKTGPSGQSPAFPLTSRALPLSSPGGPRAPGHRRVDGPCALRPGGEWRGDSQPAPPHRPVRQAGLPKAGIRETGHPRVPRGPGCAETAGPGPTPPPARSRLARRAAPQPVPEAPASDPAPRQPRSYLPWAGRDAAAAAGLRGPGSLLRGGAKSRLSHSERLRPAPAGPAKGPAPAWPSPFLIGCCFHPSRSGPPLAPPRRLARGTTPALVRGRVRTLPRTSVPRRCGPRSRPPSPQSPSRGL